MKEPRQAAGRWLPRAAIGIICATFLSDVAHEMATAVLPMYFASVGLGAAALGAMEGVADFLNALSKIAGGVVGHRIRHKREAAAVGYAITALGTSAMGLTRTPLLLASFRSIAWTGRGFRGPLRDYLLSASTAKESFGRVYGLERTADMLGAVAGPLIALALVTLGVSFHSVMLMAVAPGLGAAASVLFLAREPAAESKGEAAKPRADYKLPAGFYRFMGGVALFGMGDFSRSLLIFLAAKAFSRGAGAATTLTWGMSGATFAVLLFAMHNVVSAVAAYPAGRLSDRFPKKRVLMVGYALGAVTNVILFLAYDTEIGMVVAVGLSGIYIAIEETVEKAAVASSLPKDKRALGFGVLAGANAVGDMVSSVYVGLLLDSSHPERAFAVAATLSVLGTLAVGFVAPDAKRDAA